MLLALDYVEQPVPKHVKVVQEPALALVRGAPILVMHSARIIALRPVKRLARTLVMQITAGGLVRKLVLTIAKKVATNPIVWEVVLMDVIQPVLAGARGALVLVLAVAKDVAVLAKAPVLQHVRAAVKALNALQLAQVLAQ